MPSIQHRSVIGLYAMAFVALVDQITKWMILDRMDDVHRTIPITSFLNIVLVWNKGVTFGIFSGAGKSHILPYVLMGIAVIILIFLGRWLLKTSSTMVAVAIGAIMGGAIGNNLIDRLRYGAVLDFLDFYYGNFHWYAFNVADAAIVAGTALLLIDGMIRGN